jgi:hypothetical protein
MPRTVNDIEQDSAPDIRVARRALNSNLQDNTKIDRVSDEVKDDQSNKRTDDDGGQDKSKNPDSVFYKGDDNTSEGNDSSGGNDDSSDDENLGNFVRDLFGDKKDDDEEIEKPADRGPTNEELDNEEPGGNEQSGEEANEERTGQFGSNVNSGDDNTNDPQKQDEKVSINYSRRNRSKGVTVTYKGVTYQVDTKGTESDVDMGGAEEWLDDTFTIGSTVINLSEFSSKSESEKLEIVKNALGESSTLTTPPSGKKYNVNGLAWFLKRDSKYGARVSIADPDDTKKSIFFDDTGNITVKGVTYTAKEVFYENESAVAWLKKQVDDTKSDELAALYAGWGFTPDTPPADSPKDENPATNPDDPEKKFEPKLKENTTPEGAPTNVENSAALTTGKLRELNGKIVAPGASINMWASHIDYKVPKYPTSTGYYGIRDQKAKTDGLGFAKDEYNIETKLVGAVKVYFNAQWEKLISGTPIPVAKKSEDLNLIDYPIIMNFTEVGVWNKKVPYVADTQTEQHRMLYKGYSGGRYNMDKWGIGSYGAGENKGGFANWSEQPHWCGIFTQHCISHGGYTFPGEPVGLAAANKINDVYFNSSLKKLKEVGLEEASECFANVPTYLDSAGKSIPVKKFLDKKGFGVKGGKSDYFTDVYGILLESATYSETTETEVVMIPDGNKLKPKKKTKVNREKIPVAVRESLLPNPIMVYFIGGIHFTKDGLTSQGKKLLEHFLSQRGWEVSIISRGGHIEVCPYINPDGTIARFGGNTGASSFVSRDGGKFAAKGSSIWAFSGGAKAGTFVVFTKVVPMAGSQKVEPTMNGQFRRTPIVDSYYRSIDSKTILPTLKNVLYDQIVEKE